MAVDDQLRAIAERSAARYSDATIAASDWTRGELVDAIHDRLRTKYSDMRTAGDLVADLDGQVRPRRPGECPTPAKAEFRSQAAALRWWRRKYFRGGKDRLYAYQCPSGAHWHLTSQTPNHRRDVRADTAREADPR